MGASPVVLRKPAMTLAGGLRGAIDCPLGAAAAGAASAGFGAAGAAGADCGAGAAQLASRRSAAAPNTPLRKARRRGLGTAPDRPRHCIVSRAAPVRRRRIEDIVRPSYIAL